MTPDNKHTIFRIILYFFQNNPFDVDEVNKMITWGPVDGSEPASEEVCGLYYGTD